MQTKNVNLLQSNPENTSAPIGSPPAASSTSTAAASPVAATNQAPPLPPRTSQGRPHPDYASTNLAPTHESPYYSPYKPVPLPKPVPPPYRQPPHPLSPSPTSGAPPLAGSNGRLSNIETAAVLMPGAMVPDANFTYVTHSAKFPIKREHDISTTAEGVNRGETPEQRIPKLSEVRRMQRPKSANAITPEPLPRTQQAWTEESKNQQNGGVQQRLRSLLSQTMETEEQQNQVKPKRAPNHAGEDGEPLLIRSRSGPVYPLGIDNQGMETGDVGYVPSKPHQRPEGPRGTAGPNQDHVYRAQFVTTSTESEHAIGHAPSQMAPGEGDYGTTSDGTQKPASSSSYNLRNACSRMYQRPGTKAIHSSMQNLKGSMSSLQSAGRPMHGEEENPYGSRASVAGSSVHRHPQSPPPRNLAAASSTSLTLQVHSEHYENGHQSMEGRHPSLNERLHEDSALRDADESVRSAYEQRGPGPHRYYHLKDMMSGSGEQHQEYGRIPDKREKVYGVIGKFGAITEESTNSYGPARADNLRCGSMDKSTSAENEPNRSPDCQPPAEAPRIESQGVNQGNPQRVPLSSSSTSSESGHGTMQTGAPSTKSGSLNTSSESEIVLGGRLAVSNSPRSAQEEAVVAAGEARLEVQKQQEVRVGGVASEGREKRHLWSASVENELRQILDVKSAHKQHSDIDDGFEVGLADERGKNKLPNFSVNNDKVRDTFNLHESTFSDSFSVTPPLPPLSPPATPPRSPNAAGGRMASKYKLSASAGNLHKASGTTPDILETTRNGSMHNLKESSSRMAGRKSASRNKSRGDFGYDSRPWSSKNRTGQGINGMIGGGGKYAQLHSRVPVQYKGSSMYTNRAKGSQISLGAGLSLDSHDGEVTSTTTGLDMDSLLDDAELSTDDGSSQTEGTEIHTIRRQLESLEGMYSEVMRMLGVKEAPRSQLMGQRSLHDLRPSRRKVFGSLSSLTGKGYPTASGGTRTGGHKDRQSQGDRKKGREPKGVGRRFQRLESHVVTLARSVAHLSSEMRTQHIMFQELENLRQEVGQLHDQQAALRSNRLGHGGGGATSRSAGGAAAAGREWDNFRCSIPSLTNPARVKKLTKFFGDEPPLLRLFLKKLGYEKYASQFENEKIGIIELPYLTEERLQKIGIPMGPRMRILQEAQMSFRQEHFNIYIV